MHGIIWTDLDKMETYKEVEKIWQYGHIWPRETTDRKRTYVNEKPIGYTVKYISKIDEKHKHYKPIILTSAGIGGSYIKRHDSINNKFKGDKTIETYRTRTGHKISLPIYWRNKIYNDSEREALWLQRLDKEERWINGVRVDISNGMEQYEKLLKEEQEKNIKMGYGTDEKNWQEEQYERDRRIIMQNTRIKKGKKKQKE